MYCRDVFSGQMDLAYNTNELDAYKGKGNQYVDDNI